MFRRLGAAIIISLIAIVAVSAAGFVVARQNRARLSQEKANLKAPSENVTIIEGWTIDDIAEYLEKKGIITAQGFLEQLRNMDTSAYPLLASKPRSASLEGYLFPDTYSIPLHANDRAGDTSTSSLALIKKMLDNFSLKFNDGMLQQAKTRGLSVYEIVTLASIIEKETGRNALTAEARQKLLEERKIVAGIFYNRLKAGQPLQSDATINYVTKKRLPSATLEDLEINSPYNTYKHPGLPPGPIGNPSLSSLQAALDPATTDYWYFLHKQPSGEPVYSKTFEEHVQNKFKYLK